MACKGMPKQITAYKPWGKSTFGTLRKRLYEIVPGHKV